MIKKSLKFVAYEYDQELLVECTLEQNTESNVSVAAEIGYTTNTFSHSFQFLQFCRTNWLSCLYQKNAMLAGAATGAVLSAVGKKGKDTIVIDAILGGALATASQFVNNHYFY